MRTDQSHQKALLMKAERLQGLLTTISEAQELLNEPGVDEEMAELARIELAQAEEALPDAEKAVMIAL